MSYQFHRFYWPWTLVLGLGVILACELMLLVDVALRGGAVAPHQDVPALDGPVQVAARWAAQNVTPICWTGFLLVMDGILTWQSRHRCPAGTPSPVRSRPARFALCFLASVPIWLVFDWINFSFMDAWRYHGLPESTVHRFIGYFLAFGAISPAMFLVAEWYQRLGLRWLPGRAISIGRRMQAAAVAAGAWMIIFPMIVQASAGTLTLWLGWFLLLDPINRWFGAPSLIADWQAGRWGRTVALGAGGATCGLLWEFWNYWATAKWTYNLPFLGPLEGYRYFEMPLLGLLGFPPFALECWVMFQSVVLVLDRLGLGLAEPLPDRETII